MPVTLENGLRAYCQILEPQAAERPLSVSAAAGGCLLVKPISQLMRQVTEHSVSALSCSSTMQPAQDGLTPESISVFRLALGGERGSRSCCGYCRPGRAESSRQCDHWYTFSAGVPRLLMLLFLWISILFGVKQRVKAAISRWLVAGTGGATEAAWVDKYRPRTFLDLLSDEQINRSVVRCLLCVGRPGRARATVPESAQGHRG